jgi:hypothetical protein
MKTGLIAACLLGAVALLWLVRPQSAPPEAETPMPDPAVQATRAGESLALQTDAAEVFRRAFWRHPTDQDIIKNGERREWSETGDQQLRRWQWFIQVSPGPELLDILQDEASFGLTRSDAPRPWASLATPPQWFPQRDAIAGYQIYQSPRGGLTVFHLPEENLLFATDEGHGMASPVVSD